MSSMRLRLQDIRLWLAIPLVMILVAACWFAWREWNAAQQFDRALAQLRSEHRVVDNASAEADLRARTHTEGTAAWNRISYRCSNSWTGSLTDRLPHLGNAPQLYPLNAESDWDEASQAGEYLTWMAPLIDEIDAASSYPTPVWQPILFDGFSTLLEPLQNSRQIARLLALETEYAIYTSDTKRALRGLRLMKLTADAYDWNNFLVGKLINIALHGMQEQMIRRSLQADIWSLEELVELRSLIAPAEDIQQIWPQLVDSERAMSVEYLADRQRTNGRWAGMSWLSQIPSIRQEYWRMTERWSTLGSEGLAGLVQRSHQMEDDFAAEARSDVLSNPIYALLGPAYSSIATAFQRQEDTRRLTLTALGIKQFQMTEKRWPENLSELEAVGLSPTETSTLTEGPFGFEVADDKAYVWSYDPNPRMQPPMGVSKVSATRPTLAQQEDIATAQEALWFLAEIW
ncbi:hypothetical protein [Aureliella helgolandensis]|uniref:Uncharacterized protein n=1 Tax=Aureliella helgolandensis TaxID=2527968 RepID=A0A518GFV4_9BACT|nr:hypothetical protein [Aureliella helgolandensis]QDV27486.1 hypothetical protein Q31a_58750 [Aureliella helgolandensis]